MYVLNFHAPTEEKDPEAKDECYEQVANILENLIRYDNKREKVSGR